METQTAVNAFETMIAKAAAHGEIKLGNVCFWMEGDKMLFDTPNSAWDVPAITKDLTAALTATEQPKDRTDCEAAIMLRLARAGVQPWDLDRLVAFEIGNRVTFSDLGMNQQSQAYGDYRSDSGDTHCSYSKFVESIANFIDWNKETGKPWESEVRSAA